TVNEIAHYDKIANAHTLTLDPATGFAYAVGVLMGETCGMALHMIDVRTPTKPTFAGCYVEPNVGGILPGYVHDSHCLIYRGPDKDHQGREICLNSSGGSL